MRLIKPSRLAFTALLALLPLCSCAADFAPPAIGPVAFRRDRMPLAARTMAGLSRDLEMIARALPSETAPQRQAAARALALAIALDPSNEEPRKLLEIYQNGARPPDVEEALLAESRAGIWQHIAWLESPDAGADGQALASCLKDVMAVADPEHPKSADLLKEGEKGAWAGWVRDVHAYEPRKIADTHQPAEQPNPVPGDTPSALPEITLPKASVQAVFRQRTGTGNTAQWTHAPAPLQMRASPRDEGGFSLLIGPEGGTERLMESARLVRWLLEKQHGVLPSRMRVRIFGGELMRAVGEGKVPDVTAAAALLASAAITGREPDAVVIGQLDEVGAFKTPSRFWDQLQALGKGNGRRVVLPAAAGDWLTAFIVMENPGFFMEHEVLLASDFRQLLEMGAKTPEGAVADAVANFQEIRSRSEGQDLRAYLANRFVRQRLEEIVKAAPFHASAAMLLLQGSVDRPRQLSRQALASELRRAIEPMAWISQLGYLDSNSRDISEFNTIYKNSRLDVDRIERYVAKTDLDLWEGSREVTASLWKLNRATKARGEYDAVQSEIQNAMSDFSRLYRDMSEQLDGAAR